VNFTGHWELLSTLEGTAPESWNSPAARAICRTLNAWDARIEEGAAEHCYTCAHCGKLCDVFYDSEYQTSEAWGAVEVRKIDYLASECCNADVSETRDGAYGGVA
jgi:hypothetical protein